MVQRGQCHSLLSEALGKYKILHLLKKILLASNQKPQKHPQLYNNDLANLDPGLPAGRLAKKEHSQRPLISFASTYNVCDYAADKISQTHMEQQNHRPVANLGTKNKTKF